MAAKAAAKQQQYQGTGRRKSCTARVFLTAGKGDIVINGRKLEQYFGRETARMVVKQPLVLTDNLDKFDIKVTVQGSGIMGQAGAIRHGIARALIQYDETGIVQSTNAKVKIAKTTKTTAKAAKAAKDAALALEAAGSETDQGLVASATTSTTEASDTGASSLRRILRKAGYVTRDPRKVERKKVAHRKARKSEQYRKR